MKIEIIKYNSNLKIPTRTHDNDAGLDCYLLESYTIKPGETIKVPLGFGVRLPDGILGTMISRSSSAVKGLHSHMSPIDSGYTGEIHLIVTNISNQEKYLEKTSRVGQLVFLPFIIADLTYDINNNRQNKAFGSSGE